MYKLLDSYLDSLNRFQGSFCDSSLDSIPDGFLDGFPVNLLAELHLL